MNDPKRLEETLILLKESYTCTNTSNLKEISKISFDENAPEFCECSDGINLFFFCFNLKIIFSQHIFNIILISNTIKVI